MSKHRIVFSILVSLGAISTLAMVATLAFAGGLALAPQLNVVAQAADGEGGHQPTSSVSAEPACW